MRKLIVNLLWMVSATALLVIASPTAARAEESIVTATVPFAFIVGNLRLPAGDYVVRQTFDTPDVLTITSKDGRQTATILTIPSLPDPQAATSELVFEKFAGQHFLSRVEAGDGDAREIVLTPAIMEHELATTASNAGQ